MLLAFTHRKTGQTRILLWINLQTTSVFCRTWHLEGRGSRTRNTGKEKSLYNKIFPKEKWTKKQQRRTHFIVVGAVGGFLHLSVLFIVSDLHTDHGIHIHSHQLPGLYHSHTHLESNHQPLLDPRFTDLTKQTLSWSTLPPPYPPNQTTLYDFFFTGWSLQ